MTWGLVSFLRKDHFMNFLLVSGGMSSGFKLLKIESASSAIFIEIGPSAIGGLGKRVTASV